MTDLHCAFCGKRQSAGGSAWCVSPFKDQLHVFDGSHPLDRLDYGTAAERAIHKTQTIGPVAMKSPTRPDAVAEQDDDEMDALVLGLEELQRAQSNFVQARAAMNAAIPALEAAPAERALYDERYKADHKAQRELDRVALAFAEAAETNNFAAVIADRLAHAAQSAPVGWERA